MMELSSRKPVPSKIDDLEPVGPATGQLLGDRVVGRLVHYITSHGLLQGQELPSESALARAFGVSQRIVREALRTLSQEGIIKTRQGKRAVVDELRPVTAERYFRYSLLRDGRALGELFELRLAIETRSASMAAERSTEEDRKAILAAYNAWHESGDDLELYVARDIAFHQTIVDAAHNRFFSWIVEALADSLREERLHGARGRLQQHQGIERTVAGHQAIVDAIVGGESQAASNAMRRHLQEGLTDLLRTEGPVSGRRRMMSYPHDS